MRIVQNTTFEATTAVPLTFVFDQAKRYHFALNLEAANNGDVFALLELTDSNAGGGGLYGFVLCEVEPTGTTMSSSLVVASSRNFSPAYGWATLFPRLFNVALFQAFGKAQASVAPGGYVASMVSGLTDVNYDGGQITLTAARAGQLIVYEERIIT
jgi:hypothetical protein